MIYVAYALIIIIGLWSITIFAALVLTVISAGIRWLAIMRIPTFQVAKVLPVPEVNDRYWNQIGRIIDIQDDGQIALQFRRWSSGIFHPDTIVIYNNEFRDLEDAEEAL